MKSTPVACAINMLQIEACLTVMIYASGFGCWKQNLFIYYCKILHPKDFYSSGHKIKHFNQFCI
jgi:hypothetical protein